MAARMTPSLLSEQYFKLKDLPDRVIIKLVIEGQKPAFTELVLRHSARLRNFLRQLSGQHSLADDLAQLTFLQIWQKISQLKSADAFVTWSNRIAVNIWLEERRRVTLDITSDEEVMERVADPKPTPERVVDGLDLERALRQLNHIERLCVILSFREGYTHDQIAELVKIPLGTAKSHVLRGSAKLKTILSGDG
jgi:RNA polymerase sigma factor (sigma-70 family)